jgi:hypothetical protein
LNFFWGSFPRGNPKAEVSQEIAVVSEEIDRLQKYQKDPKNLEVRLQDLQVKLSGLLDKFREVSTTPVQPKEQRQKKKEG